MLKYSFKFYYADGSSKVSGGKSASPESLKYDFDGAKIVIVAKFAK